MVCTNMSALRVASANWLIYLVALIWLSGAFWSSLGVGWWVTPPSEWLVSPPHPIQVALG